MAQTSKTGQIKHRVSVGRGSLCVAGLIALATIVLFLPRSAPVAALSAIVMIIWAIRRKPDVAPAKREDLPEPALWDDGFGAT